ncbi:MAG: leucine-rich repeat protein, partial [Bacteroidales bacterium]|nr:leucine-rich repeat protein [Bacteroidales bacterium]
LPDSVERIGYQAFCDCTNLSSINIPLNWNSATDYYSGEIFSGCSSLKSITVPEGITELPDYAFYGCNYLQTVNLPDSLDIIGTSAFEGCSRLRYVNSAFASLTTIQSRAFYGCERLRLLILSEKVVSLGSQIFTNCPLLTVLCPELSYSAVYMIDNDFDFTFLENSVEDAADYVLDRSGTYYVTNTTTALSNGYVTMNLGYKFKDSVAKNVSDLRLSIRIPSDLTLIEKTVMLDGIRQTGYEFEDNLLTLNVSNPSGELSFCLNPTKDSKVATYALMSYMVNGELEKEIIGILNDSIPILSIDADSEVNTNIFEIRGIGPADSVVSVYLDGVLQCTSRTNKAGSYTSRVTIVNPKNYQTYTVSVRAATSDGSVEASQKVKYCELAPSVSSFTMRYNGSTYNMLDESGVKTMIAMEGGELFNFHVKFRNPEQADRVYICSTKSNVTKRIEAFWSEEAQAYVAEGLFDPSGSSYVPGAITVEYSTVREPLNFLSGNIDYTSDKYINGASDPIRAALAGKLEDCIEDLVSDDKQISGIIKLVDVDAQLDFNILTDIIPSYLDPDNAGEYGYEVMEDDYGAKLYLKVAEYGEDKIRGEIIDFAQEKFTEFCIEGKYIDLDVAVGNYFTFVDALDYADTLVTWDNNRISLNESKQAILSSNMSDAQKSEALKKLDYASKANNGVVAAMALQVILGMAGVAIPFPASMILPLLAMQNENYVNGFLGQFGHLKASQKSGAKFVFRWVIDPSGYVYDAVSNERLEGVTVTAYSILYDESETFWDNVPEETEYGTVWNSLEYNQMNPLVTDSEGRYAWDVPEGWWRVKYEKDGYETVWSEWLPVPPPQTDVNIGMVPIGSDVHVHEFVTTTVEPTCTEEGSQTSTCSTCGYSETVVLQALGHNYVDGLCTRCGIAEEGNGPQIVSQPVDYVGLVGDMATFTVVAEGEGLKYQWYFYDTTASSWQKSSGNTSATLSVEFKAYRVNQEYRCEITDANGNTITTDVVKLV